MTRLFLGTLLALSLLLGGCHYAGRGQYYEAPACDYRPVPCDDYYVPAYDGPSRCDDGFGYDGHGYRDF